MKTSQIYTVMLAGLALTGLSSCGLKKEKITETPPVKVSVMPATASASTSSRTYSGTVTPGNGADVSFTIPGTIKAIYVDAGQKVRKGQLLAELKDGTLQNNYNIAKAALNEARDAYDRFKKLHEAKALADIRWVEVENTLTQARNAAEIARRALDDAKIYAPVNGTVSEKNADVGQTAVPAIPIMRIVALNDVKVSIPVPENEIGAMTEGENATIKVEALNNREISGRLTEKGIVANPLTRAYDVRFSVDNSKGDLLPGMLCSVSLNGSTATTQNAIVLPAQAILLAADNRNFVWLAREGKATRRFVKTGDITPEGITIADGIAPGDTVIIAGMQKVSEGTRIDPQL